MKEGKRGKKGKESKKRSYARKERRGGREETRKVGKAKWGRERANDGYTKRKQFVLIRFPKL